MIFGSVLQYAVLAMHERDYCGTVPVFSGLFGNLSTFIAKEEPHNTIFLNIE